MMPSAKPFQQHDHLVEMMCGEPENRSLWRVVWHQIVGFFGRANRRPAAELYPFNLREALPRFFLCPL